MVGTVTAPIMFSAGAWLLAGCATIMGGTTQPVSFQSSPEGVLLTLLREVKVGGFPAEKEMRVLGTTLHSRSNWIGWTMTNRWFFHERGKAAYHESHHEAVRVVLGQHSAFGGLLGSTTDSASGAAYEYTLDQFFVTLNQTWPHRLSTAWRARSATTPSSSSFAAMRVSWPT